MLKHFQKIFDRSKEIHDMQDSTKREEEALSDCLATQASLQIIVAKHSERFEKQESVLLR